MAALNWAKTADYYPIREIITEVTGVSTLKNAILHLAQSLLIKGGACLSARAVSSSREFWETRMSLALGSLVESFCSTLGSILGQVPIVGDTLASIVGDSCAIVLDLLSNFGLG